MKSAYELAMSRLEKTSPTVKLNEKQKQEIAEIDSQYAAKIAERKMFLEGEILKARQSSDDTEGLQKQLAAEIARIEEEREEKKEKIRKPR